MKTKSLEFSAQSANFAHLMSMLQGAVTFAQAKKIWPELRKMEQEAKNETGEECWVLGYEHNQQLLAEYNFLKQTKFAKEVETEKALLKAQCDELEKRIRSAQSTDDLRPVYQEIYKIWNKEAKEHLTALARNAYKELLEIAA